MLRHRRHRRPGVPVPANSTAAAVLTDAQARTELELICVRTRLEAIDEHTADQLALLLDTARAVIDDTAAATD